MARSTTLWTKTQLKELLYQVNGACIKVHKALGPGLLESVYHKCVKQELIHRSISFESELRVPIIYNKMEIESNLRCDLLIENILVVELKAIDSILPIHEAQLLTYMRLLNVPKGLILNFNVVNLFSQGQKTMVNEQFRKLPE